MRPLDALTVLPLLSLLALGGQEASADPPAPAAEVPPIELGTVRWGDDLEAAERISSESGRPIFLLFQEVPGCATCQGFGREVLTDPIIVEAIDTLFVPVVVHNNRAGHEEEILRRFQEPSWNNPVVRIVDGTGTDLIPRRDGIWSATGIAARMVAGLEAAGRPVPAWFERSIREWAAPTEEVVLGMHCFWEGEAALGGIDGVLDTRAAFHDGQEVVVVRIDTDRLPVARLLEVAGSRGAAHRAFVPLERKTDVLDAGLDWFLLTGRLRLAPESDQKHALRRSALRLLPLTPGQFTRVNAAVASGGNPYRWLSPRQRALLARVESTLVRDPGALRGLRVPPVGGDRAATLAALTAALDASDAGRASDGADPTGGEKGENAVDPDRTAG